MAKEQRTKMYPPCCPLPNEQIENSVYMEEEEIAIIHSYNAQLINSIIYLKVTTLSNHSFIYSFNKYLAGTILCPRTSLVDQW